MSKTPSEAAVRASRQIHETIGRVFGLTPPKQDLIEEGARLIDEAYRTDEVVKALEEAEKASWHSEAFVKRDWRDLVSRVLSHLKGTDDAH